ncbi:endonuclease domain-containing 1 protein-like [Symphorus nematophorus]
MASVKTGYLFFLAAFLFLTIVPTVAEVVNAVADCNQYLLQNKPPELPGILVDGNIQDQNRYKPICQTFDNKPRFLTLYDITNKIPVFSAYKYIGIEDKGRPTGYWKIEPQLEGKPDKNMEDEGKGATYTNQASSTDYINSDHYDKGHLNPSTHGSTDDDKESTMTLTNIVPQADDFNQKRWSKMEDCIKCVMDRFCIDNNKKIEGFVVTGAEPGTKKLNDKVNIPSIVWSGFCCRNPKKNMWIASAHWDNNVREGPAKMPSQPLNDLYETLGGANLFPGPDCPTDKKLGDYGKLKITQTCPVCN